MQPAEEDPSPINFIKAFGHGWLTRMSGPVSVPLAVVAFFVANEMAKVLLGATAIACAVLASYWVWKRERVALVKMQSKTRELEEPKLRLSFRENDRRYLFTDGDREVACIYLHNDIAKTITNIEAYTNGIVPSKIGSHNLVVRPRVSSPPLQLSPGEEHPVRIIWYASDSLETIHYAGGTTLSYEGEEFLMKLVVIGKDMYPAIRKQITFGIAENHLYVHLREDSGQR